MKKAARNPELTKGARKEHTLAAQIKPFEDEDEGRETIPRGQLVGLKQGTTLILHYPPANGIGGERYFGAVIDQAKPDRLIVNQVQPGKPPVSKVLTFNTADRLVDRASGVTLSGVYATIAEENAMILAGVQRHDPHSIPKEFSKIGQFVSLTYQVQKGYYGGTYGGKIVKLEDRTVHVHMIYDDHAPDEICEIQLRADGWIGSNNDNIPLVPKVIDETTYLELTTKKAKEPKQAKSVRTAPAPKPAAASKVPAPAAGKRKSPSDNSDEEPIAEGPRVRVYRQNGKPVNREMSVSAAKKRA